MSLMTEIITILLGVVLSGLGTAYLIILRQTRKNTEDAFKAMQATFESKFDQFMTLHEMVTEELVSLQKDVIQQGKAIEILVAKMERAEKDIQNLWKRK